jgi:hypothetical protein
MYPGNEDNATRAVMSEAWQGRAYKNDPVDHFSEGARLQGRFAVRVQISIGAGEIAVQANMRPRILSR